MTSLLKNRDLFRSECETLRACRSQLGFTIIEMVITISVVSIVFVLASTFLVDSLEAQRYVNEQNDAIVESRKALETITSELRESIQGDDGAYPLELLEAQELIFFSDVDNDEYSERIRYFISGTNLQRSVIEPTEISGTGGYEYLSANETTETIAQYIQNDTDPLFYYYNEQYPEDETNNPLTVPADATEVRLIEVRVETNVDPNQIPDTRELSVFTHIRNLKENF